MSNQYWEDALGEALCEIDAYNNLTKEQQKRVANYMRIAAELHSECHGYDQIQHPAIDELKRVRQQHDQKEQDQSQIQRTLINALANKLGVRPTQIDVDGDTIVVHQR